jgi:O-antigen/teichoic acid export membrane protein
MNSGSANQLRLALGLSKTCAWFAVSRTAQIAAGVWVTRRLDPGDFTLLAVIFALQGIVQQLSTLNLTSGLVRAQALEKQDVDVAWSYEQVRNLLVWIVLAAFAPLLAAGMGHPEATGGLRISAFGLLIGGFRNPRLVELRREGKFGRLAWIESSPLIAYAIFAVSFVAIRPDYNSLIFAGLASTVAGVIVSHIGLPVKLALNFDFQRLRPMLAFGLVLLLGSGLFAMREHGIVFVASASGLTGDLGFLNRGIAFSMALALQASGLFWKVAYPHYSTVHRQGGDVVREAKLASHWLLIIGLPVALLVGAFSEPIIDTVLGAQWNPVAALWQWLLPPGALFVAIAPLEAALQAMHRERIQVAVATVSTGLYLMVAWLLIPSQGIIAVGMAACVSTIFSLLVLRVVLAKCKAVFNKSRPSIYFL